MRITAIVFILTISLFCEPFFSQTNYVKIGNLNLELEFDPLASSMQFQTFKLKKNDQQQKKVYFNSPVLSIETFDIDNRPIIIIDSLNSCNCAQIDSNFHDDFKISLITNNRIIDSVRFAYKVYAEDYRITHEITDIENSTGVTKKIYELMNPISNGGLIIYGISFYEKEVIYYLSIGYLCFMKR